VGVAVEGLTLDIEVESTVGSIEGKADGTVGSDVGSIVDGR
jgi:hypothetical protein